MTRRAETSLSKSITDPVVVTRREGVLSDSRRVMNRTMLAYAECKSDDV